ncbi:MAG: hypothetical protein MUF87_14920 [Anaerolineae bacterium]|jgi:hypothetical protein|nr:hypothetical protein [Anaerolineae bacterium]
MKKVLISMLILALFSVVSSHKAQEIHKVIQKCGNEQNFDPSPAFWINTPLSGEAVWN